MQAKYSLSNWLKIVTCALLVTLPVHLRSEAQETLQFSNESPSEILSRVVRRLDELELENEEIRNENARLLDVIQTGSLQSLIAKPPRSTAVARLALGKIEDLQDVKVSDDS